MMMTPAEKKMLKKISESNLITKNELKEFMKNNGVSSMDSSIKSLVDKDFITTISPIGSTCYIITKKGTRFLSEQSI